MDKNKGIIGIGLIIAIVLGIVIVGGGAYYLGKSGSKQAINNPENILPNNQDQNLQPVNQNQPVDNSVKAVTLDMSSELAKTYTTAFTNALKQPANFDGHYVVASWGCGSGCLGYGIVDKLTGKVYQAPGDDYGNTAGYSGDAEFNANRWLLSSNIFKVIGYTSIDSYNFDNEKFTKIGSNPFPINSVISTTNWKTYINKEFGVELKYPPLATVTEKQWPSRTDLGSTYDPGYEIVISVPFITHYDAWTSKAVSLMIHKGSCTDYLPASITLEKKTINGITYSYQDPEWTATSGMSTISKWRRYYHESPSRCYIIDEGLSGLGNNERPSTYTFPSDVNKFLDSELVDLDKIMASVKIN